jgi:cation transport ATPase
LSVVTLLPVGWMSETDLLRSVTAVACGCGHPSAEALLREADVRIVHVVDALNCERTGAGAAGVVSGSRVLLGAPEFLLDHGVDLSALPPIELLDGMLFAAVDGRFAGIVTVGGW